MNEIRFSKKACSSDENDFYAEAIKALKEANNTDVYLASGTPVLLLASELYTPERKEYFETIKDSIFNSRFKAHYLFCELTTKKEFTANFQDSPLFKKQVSTYANTVSDMLLYDSILLKSTPFKSFFSGIVTKKWACVHIKEKGNKKTKMMFFLRDKNETSILLNSIFKPVFDNADKGYHDENIKPFYDEMNKEAYLSKSTEEIIKSSDTDFRHINVPSTFRNLILESSLRASRLYHQLINAPELNTLLIGNLMDEFGYRIYINRESLFIPKDTIDIVTQNRENLKFEIFMDDISKRVYVKNKHLSLSPESVSYKLLKTILQNVDKFISKDQIYELSIYPMRQSSQSNIVRVRINQLKTIIRKKTNFDIGKYCIGEKGGYRILNTLNSCLIQKSTPFH